MTWAHTPRSSILIWCLWAFPLTIWDTIYLALRPHSLPGRKWHAPYFAGTFNKWAGVDHSYGKDGWLDQDGFVMAQSVINMLEVTLYMIYVTLVWRGSGGFFGKKVGGRSGALAVIVGMNAGCVTATKTALYFMRECLSGFKSTGHNHWKPFLMTWGGMK
ncbi:hypothetical protein N0V90_007102 [Kalmusia sp. IMI 367209]|nr:hypothetical protein N0V90_007102 [Kalmusia sp. IMI 367209]